LIGDCVGPRAVLDAVVKRKIPSLGFGGELKTPHCRKTVCYKMLYCVCGPL